MSKSAFITPLDDAFKQSAKNLLGAKGFLSQPADFIPYLEDWRGGASGVTPCIALPDSTKQVSAFIQLCFQHNIAITPQGGNTGLVRGGLPSGEVILSTKRLNNIRNVDVYNNTLIAEAGVILKDIQDTAKAHDRLFPLSLGSEGSAHIGGLASTNAGGVNVLHYGMMRDLTLGLEVVLPDGQIWEGLRVLRKDNTGYDLKQLFIGAEGTLGIITALSLKLFARPRYQLTAWCSLADSQKALDLFYIIKSCVGEQITSFELIPQKGVALVGQYIPTLQDPMPDDMPWRILLECSANTENTGRTDMESALGDALDKGLITNAVIADNLGQAKTFWDIRAALPEAKRKFYHSINHDIALPISKIPHFLEDMERAVGHHGKKNLTHFVFGHIGDGNLHYSLVLPDVEADKATIDQMKMLSGIVYDRVIFYGGSISAEHGIGTLKRDLLLRSKSPLEIGLMRQLKQAFDPNNLMNPGRIFES